MAQAPNLKEFSTIAALILKAAFSTFPLRVDLDFLSLARSMGLDDLSTKLESGQPFSTVAANTLKWLMDNDYIHAAGVLPRDRITLTEKGLAAMMRKSPNSQFPFNEEIETASTSANTPDGRQRLAEIIGSFIGSAASSFTKGISGS